MTPPNQESTDADGSSGIDRRKVLKMVGGSAAGIAVMTGTASAWRSQFYGCSQVCSDSKGGAAVVEVDGDYECRSLQMDDWNSDRQNQEWSHGSACYEVSGDESIVGVVHGSDCTFCVNPNNCASNYYDSVDDIIDAIDDDGCGCTGDVERGTECEVFGTGGGNGNGRGNGGGNDGNNGRGKGR